MSNNSFSALIWGPSKRKPKTNIINETTTKNEQTYQQIQNELRDIEQNIKREVQCNNRAAVTRLVNRKVLVEKRLQNLTRNMKITEAAKVQVEISQDNVNIIKVQEQAGMAINQSYKGMSIEQMTSKNNAYLDSVDKNKEMNDFADDVMKMEPLLADDEEIDSQVDALMKSMSIDDAPPIEVYEKGSIPTFLNSLPPPPKTNAFKIPASK